MDETNKETTIAEGKTGIYEIGFLIVPTIAEENVPAEFQNIKSLVEKNGGVFISEDFPKLRSLAYQMSVSTESKKTKFDQAYFGWIKFEIATEHIPKIKIELDRNTQVIRSLLISTVRESTLSAPKMAFRMAADGDRKKTSDATPLSQEELDKTIDNLVVQ